MVAPIAPEGGWKEWFITHPYQHTKYPILRASNVRAVFYDYTLDEGGNIKPFAEPQFEFVEMWYDPRARQIWGQLGLHHKEWFRVTASSSETTWANGVESLFDFLLKQEPESKQQQPEPVDSGWDDFDWSI